MAASQAEVRKVDNAIIANKDSTPTAAEYKRIKQQMADDKQNADNARGATSGFTTRDRMGEKFAKGGSIRGGGCESRGKTKGRMV